MNVYDLKPATTEAEARERREVLCRALDSGTYDQTVRFLHTTQGYCCQGVACDVLGAKWVKNLDTVYHESSTFATRQWPREVPPYYGISYEDGKTLARLNDEGTPFPDIAGIIRHLPFGA